MVYPLKSAVTVIRAYHCDSANQGLSNRGLETKDTGNEIEMSRDSKSENKHRSSHD